MGGIDEWRKYIIEVLEERFFPIPDQDEIDDVVEFLDNCSDEQEHKIYRLFRLINGD